MPSSTAQTARDIGVHPKAQYLGAELWKDSWALVVGINEYQEPIRPLHCAEKDAEDIAHLLPALGFPAEHTLLLLGSRDAINVDRLSTIFSKPPFQAMGNDDRLLVYFAGHGVCAHYNERTYGFLLFPDSQIEGEWPTENRPHLRGKPRNALEMQVFLRTLEQEAPKHKLLLLDTCFSGFMKSRRSATGTGHRPGPIDPARWWRYPAMQIMTAGTDGQTAVESQEYGHGLFTEYLLRGLRGAADSDCDGVLSFTDLAQYVGNEIAREGAGQIPQEESSGDGRFVFLRSEVLDWPRLKTLILAGAEAYGRRDFAGAALAWEQARTIDPAEPALVRLLESARAGATASQRRWNVILERERAFSSRQNADFAHFPLSGVRRFVIQIEIPKQSQYWRAGFALASEPYINEADDSTTIERDFQFNVGRGHLHENARVLRPMNTLHYATYAKQAALHPIREFEWPHDDISIVVEIASEQRWICLSFASLKERFELTPSDAKHLYLLAWADRYCSFRVPMRVEFLHADTVPPVFLPGQGSEMPTAFREAVERNIRYGNKIASALGPVERVQIRRRDCESQLFETGGSYQSEAVRAPGSDKAWCVRGVILEKYRERDFRSWLGPPISDETPAAPSRFGATGRYSHFAHGEIDYYKTGRFAGKAFAVNGAIADHYIRMGGTGSALGFPISDEHDAPEGRQSDFEGGLLCWVKAEERVYIAAGALILPPPAEPFSSGWRQYAGPLDPACLTRADGGPAGSCLTMRGKGTEIGIRHDLPDLRATGFEPRYCALTLRSAGPSIWYVCVGHDGPHDVYVACSSTGEKPWWPFHNEWTLPLPGGEGWHTLILDLREEAFTGLGLVSYFPEWVCFRGDLDIGQVWLSDNLDLLRRSTPQPCLLSSAQHATPECRTGSKGGGVAKAQRLLKALGFYAHDADGEFGPVMERALNEFLRSQSLIPPAFRGVGPLTWGLLTRAARKEA